MNNKFLLFAVAIFFVVISSCKNDKTSSEAANLPNFALLNQSEVNPTEIGPMRKEAEGIIERLSKVNPKVPTVLEKDLWLFEAVVRDTSFIKQEDLGGSWIDFGEDFKYTYGLFEDQIGSGKFYYDFDKQIINLLDDNNGLKPQEFKIINITPESTVFQGEYRFRDNNMQSKLKRLSAKPAQKK